MSARGVVFALLGLAIVAMAGNLARVAPSPGELAAPHAALAELAGPAGCPRCHGARDGHGFRDACVACHDEIGAQLDGDRGLHAALVAQHGADCSACHGEHYGAAFELTNFVSWGRRDRESFRHEHVAFELAGAHGALRCEQCHREAPATWLGLDQVCSSCHDDVHGPAMSDDCAGCHAQDAFRPAARFEHAKRFPLLGVHAEIACEQCHPRSAADATGNGTVAQLDFLHVTGTSCADCHESPHRAPLGDDCASCHRAADRDFSDAAPRFTAREHAAAGFELAGPHADVACARCHEGAAPDAGLSPPFAQRYPGRSARECVACHDDPHGGQFGARGSDCASCHRGDEFRPSTTTIANHRPKLRDRHRELACARCHFAPQPGVAAQFVGTPSKCAGCHDDPHAGQFAKEHPDCASCHDQKRFAPASRYDFAKLHPKLHGAHADLACASCHEPRKRGGPARFTGTPSKCSSCHDDPHAGQFGERGKDCARCHGETTFSPSTVVPERHHPPLEGAHLAVACDRCHVVAARDVRRFARTPTSCKSCHVDPHAGQLTAKQHDCDRCHVSKERWLPASFDHARQSRFALDGVHAALRCEQCHPRVSDGAREVVLYRPLGTECRDCHATR